MSLTGIAYVNACLAERERQLDAADREIDSLRHQLAILQTAVEGITPAVRTAEERGYQRAITLLRDDKAYDHYRHSHVAGYVTPQHRRCLAAYLAAMAGQETP